MKMKASDIKNKEQEMEIKLKELESYYQKQSEKRQQQFKLDQKERDEEMQGFESHLNDITKDQEMALKQIEEAKGKLEQEMSERDTKRKQLQDQYEKAKQDSIKEVNKKHDDLDR